MPARIAVEEALCLARQERRRLWSTLEQLSHGRDLSAMSPDDLVVLAAAVPSALTPQLLRAIHRYRTGALGSDVLLVRGLVPEDARFGPTPADSVAPLAGPAAQQAALLLLGIMLLLGEPFNFRSLYQGRLVQHVVPVPRMEFTQTGESSSGVLDWHVEDGFRDDRCDYFGLLCIRGNAAAVTQFAAARDLDLSREVRAVLGMPRFTMQPDTAHVLPDITPTTTQVLSGPPDRPELCYDAHYLAPEDGDAAGSEALVKLRRVLDDARFGHVLASGDLLVIDNRRVVHCRTPFPPRYDGSDRWLMRTMVCACLPSYRRRTGRIIT
jgi:L-asparagine oxygenase